MYLLTWLYDATGSPAAILDEFCIRDGAGEPAAFMFGLSAFSLRGEHIGWFEEGILFDADNRIVGFVAGARGLPRDFPSPEPAPPLPLFGKRPLAPPLRARPVRRPSSGWSSHLLGDYLEQRALSATRAMPTDARTPRARNNTGPLV